MSGSKKSAYRLRMEVEKSCLQSATSVDMVVEEKASPLQPRKPAGPPPSSTRQSGQNRRLKVAVVQGDLRGDSKSTGRAMKLPAKLPKLETSSKGAKLPANIQAETASRRKPQFHRDRDFRAVSEQHREDQSLQEAVKTEALEGVKALDPSASALRRPSLSIKQGLLGSGKPFPGMEASDKVSSQASLDRATREAAGSVCNTLQSFVASHSEREFDAEYSEIIELPNKRLSQRQPQPDGRTAGRGSPEEQSLATSRREKLPVIQPMRSTVDISHLSRRIVKESIENAASKVKEEEEWLLRRAKILVTNAVLRAKKRLEDELHQRS
ncbi:uncharacterized protein LOC125701465 [Lagopus muta]|uniref:uncharacterized protein LOC125701465 n=1 Tax=Lagopus muta TaxID=64668 RepID=UPI00209CE7D6|nr:uncharacterized protein LOC125701465 [Lagopus muta]